MVAAMRDAAMSTGGVSPGYAELLRQYAYHAGPGRVERHYREHQHAKNLLHRHRAPPNRANQNAAFRIGGSAPAHRKAPGLRPELIAQRTNPSYPLGKGAGPPIPERKPEPRVAALLCNVQRASSADGNSLGVYDRTWYQTNQDPTKPSTYTWHIARPSVGLPVGDTRGLMRPLEQERSAPMPHRTAPRGPGFAPMYRPPPPVPATSHGVRPRGMQGARLVVEDL